MSDKKTQELSEVELDSVQGGAKEETLEFPGKNAKTKLSEKVVPADREGKVEVEETTKFGTNPAQGESHV